MRKADLIKHFGNEVRVAEAFEVTKQAVNGWGDIVPRGIAYEAQVITKGTLKVDRGVYRRLKEKRKAEAAA